MSSPLRPGTLAPPPASLRDDPAAGATWYREAAPGPGVAAFVACRWAGSGGWARSLRLLPDGCADVVWDGEALHVVGALPAAARLAVGAETRNVGLRLRPGAAGAVLGCPASDLPAAPVRLDAVWGRDARRLADRLAAATVRSGTAAGTGPHRPIDAMAAGPTVATGTAAEARLHDAATAGPTGTAGTAAEARLRDAATAGPTGTAGSAGADGRRPLDPPVAGACGTPVDHLHRLLEEAVASRLGRGGAPDPAVVAAADLLRRPTASVDAVAAAVGWSPRELRRRFPAHAGLGPKALHRVLRFRRFVGHLPAVATGRASLATVAALCGYADQSHLGRECRRLSGSTPAGLVARWTA